MHRLTPSKRMTLEQAIAYIQDDELVEVTPKVIRIRGIWIRMSASRDAVDDQWRLTGI